MWVVLLVLLGACIVPKTTRTTRTLGTVSLDPDRGPVGELGLTVKTSLATVFVTAAKERQCRQPIVQIVEETTRSTRELACGDDPRAWFFCLVVSPISLPVSALVTEILIRDRDGVRERREPLRIAEYGCPIPVSGLEVSLDLPSGAQLRGTTDRDGRLQLVVPSTEPDRGELVVSTADAASVRHAYQLTAPLAYEAIAAQPIASNRLDRSVGDAVLDCAIRYDLRGTIGLKLARTDDGSLATVSLSQGGTEVAACVGERLAKLRLPPEQFAPSVEASYVIP